METDIIIKKMRIYFIFLFLAILAMFFTLLNKQQEMAWQIEAKVNQTWSDYQMFLMNQKITPPKVAPNSVVVETKNQSK